jgi:hypothetical protein
MNQFTDLFIDENLNIEYGRQLYVLYNDLIYPIRRKSSENKL